MRELPVLRQVVLDCPHAPKLAEFSRELLGLQYREGDAPPALLQVLAHPLRVFDLDDGFTMLVGADTAGRLLEVGVVEGDTALVIVHACQPVRSS